MVSGSQAHTTSAFSPPERTSLATRAFSSPVGARKSLTSLPRMCGVELLEDRLDGCVTDAGVEGDRLLLRGGRAGAARGQ